MAKMIRKYQKVWGFTPHLWKIIPPTSFSFYRNWLFPNSRLWEKGYGNEKGGYRKRNLPKVTGFTAVELLVSLSLFVILIGIAAGGFIRALRTQRAVVSLMEANDSVSFSLEQMTREMRTGINFSLPSPAEIQFTNSQGKVVFYRLNEGAIEKGSGLGRNKIYKKITTPNVEILRFNIELSGENPGDDSSPRITISLSASLKNKYLEGVTTDLQTTVSSRITDT